MKLESTTGIKRSSHSNMQFAISFIGDKCPYCGEHMYLDKTKFKNTIIRTRYLCNNCGLILPIKHLDNPNNVVPVIDNSVFSFMNNFGKDIRERRKCKI